jgi:diphthamide synthase (EF-2-diphthine--ammonia ligase)
MKNQYNCKSQSSTTFIAIAWYKSEQWQRLLDISEDRAELENTHSEWERNAVQSMRKLMRSGLRLVKISVDVEELLQWCLAENHPVNGETRSKYAAEKLRGSTTKER